MITCRVLAIDIQKPRFFRVTVYTPYILHCRKSFNTAVSEMTHKLDLHALVKEPWQFDSAGYYISNAWMEQHGTYSAHTSLSTAI